jgi:hypothetical protein
MEMVSGAPVLIVAFGGVKHGIGIDMPPFEFLRSLSAHGCDAIFLRDIRQAWYQFGVDGVAADIMGLAHWLQHRRRAYVRTATVGNSMGGYASLLIGCLGGTDIAIAFSPQTTIAQTDRAALDDHRWQPLIERLHTRSVDHRYHDVRAALELSDSGHRTSLLFYGEESREDAAHAMRLVGEPGCHLFAVKQSTHRAVQYLRENGVLADIFRMISDPSIPVRALLGHLGADKRLAVVGLNTRLQPVAGEST